LASPGCRSGHYQTRVTQHLGLSGTGSCTPAVAPPVPVCLLGAPPTGGTHLESNGFSNRSKPPPSRRRAGGRAREPGRGRRAHGAGGGRRVCGSARAPLGLLRPGCRWVWEAGSGLCGGYVRWIEPLGVLGDMSVGPGPGWSGVGWVKWKERGSGMGGAWGIGEGVGWAGRVLGGHPVWLGIPIYICALQQRH
jgi:hypothetical protein